MLFRVDRSRREDLYEEKAINTTEKSRVKNAPLEVPDAQSDFVAWAITVQDGSVSAGWQPMHPNVAGNRAIMTREQTGAQAKAEEDSACTSLGGITHRIGQVKLDK